MTTVIGLDLSLRATGVCVIEPSWDPSSGSWEGVSASTFGVSLKRDAVERERLARLQQIRDFVTRIVQMQPNAVRIAVEEYAFSKQPGQAHAIAELGGVVKLSLAERGYDIKPIPSTAVRKLLLGKGGGPGIKAAVAEALASVRSPFKDFDECDAFAVANAMRAEIGMPAITFVGGKAKAA